MAFKFTKEQLGIYLVTDRLYAVQTEGMHIVNKMEFSLNPESKEFLLDGEGAKYTNIALLLRESLEKSNIKAKKATLCLSTRDLIIRGFGIPRVPAKELTSAVIFEAKKYIPFKTEDLIFDFQYILDKQAKRSKVIFVAAKKEVLNSYMEILKQAGISSLIVEPASFSLIRLLRLFKDKINLKSSLAMVDFDMAGGNITILDTGGFPCFSCEIKFLPTSNKELEADTIFSRLSNEIRISLDYYYRQFARSNIKQILIISGKDTPDWAQDISKELDMPCLSVRLEQEDILKDIGDLKLVRAFSASLRNAFRSSFNIDLLTKQSIFMPETTTQLSLQDVLKRFAFISPLQILRPAIPMLVLISFVYIFTLPKIFNLSMQLTKLKTEPRDWEQGLIGANLTDLQNNNESNRRRLSAIENAILRNVYLTYLWNALPKLTPEGLWLERIDIKSEERGLNMNLLGLVYLNDETKDRATVNKFFNNLKQDEEFLKAFKEIKLGSINKQSFGEFNITKFELSYQ